MTRIGLLTSVGLGALLASAASVQAQAFDWNGAYAGAALAVGSVETHTTFETYDWYTYNQHSLAGLLTGGYNWQQGALVFGVEGDVGFGASGDATSDDMVDTDQVSTSVSPLATLRGRIGFATGNVLLYGTVGAAIGNPKVDDTWTPSASAEGVAVAPVFGAGLEVAISDSVSLKAEGRVANFSIDGDDGYTNDVNTAVGLVGVNFHF
jgi:outer membrane immunogenic protein